MADVAFGWGGLADWRSLQGRWDKIVPVGMLEHVGPKNDAGHFRRLRELLADEGLFLLHTIGTERTERAWPQLHAPRQMLLSVC